MTLESDGAARRLSAKRPLVSFRFWPILLKNSICRPRSLWCAKLNLSDRSRFDDRNGAKGSGPLKKCTHQSPASFSTESAVCRPGRVIVPLTAESWPKRVALLLPRPGSRRRRCVRVRGEVAQSVQPTVPRRLEGGNTSRRRHSRGGFAEREAQAPHQQSPGTEPIPEQLASSVLHPLKDLRKHWVDCRISACN